MAKPYVPPGCVGLIDAVKKIARSITPNHWDSANIPPDEARIWNELEITLNPELLEEHILAQVKNRPLSTISRIIDFREAKVMLRNYLCLGQIDSFYINERGDKILVANKFWMSPIADAAIDKGTAYFDDEDPNFVVCRYIMLASEGVERIACFKAADEFSRPPETTPSPSSEAVVREAATETLRASPNMTKTNVLAAVRARGLTVSNNNFNRAIWPAAREAAGLPPKAPAGRRSSKSNG